MEKNKRVIIIVSVLIGVIGISLAYFVGKTIFKGTGAMTEGKTATLNGSTLEVNGNINFNDENIYPGHETLSKIEVIATGNNELIAYNLIWNGTNTLNTELRYKVYKTKEDREDISLTCNKKKKVTNGIQYLNEECETNINELELIKEGTIGHSEEESTTELTDNEYITSSQTGEKVYYYIIIEYPNLTEKEKEEQNEDIGEGFKGRVHAKISDSKADINLVAFYKETEEGSGEYEEVEDIPKEGYVLNKEQTKCNNQNIELEWDNNKLTISNLTKSGTSCFLYFDVKKIGNPDETLNKLQLKKAGNLSATIDKYACDNNTNDSSHNKSGSNCTSTDSGIYETEDDFGKSYVFRGTVDNNWVHFANMYWRIIRINGNGTIRMIYSGTQLPSDGRWANQNSGNGAAITTTYKTNTYQQFNDYYNDNKYVGYMFGTAESGSADREGTSTKSYDVAHQNNYSSTIKEEIDKWYIGESGIQAQYRDKIDVETGFCSDRQLSPATHGSYLGVSEQTAGYDKTPTAYAGYHRVMDINTNFDSTQEPTLKCGNKERDLFTGPDAQGITDSEGNEIKGNNKLTYPVGLITADEVIYAGGLGGKDNYGYWLYTGQNYWTMSPSHFYGSNANVFVVILDGYLNYAIVNNAYGVRPVINIKSDVTISGKGTIDSPYEIS